MVERVVKDGEVARGEGGDKVRFAPRDVHEHAVRVQCTHLGRVAPLADIVGLLAASMGERVGAAMLAPLRDVDEHAVLGLLLVRREERRKLVSSVGPCNEIVRRA